MECYCRDTLLFTKWCSCFLLRHLAHLPWLLLLEYISMYASRVRCGHLELKNRLKLFEICALIDALVWLYVEHMVLNEIVKTLTLDLRLLFDEEIYFGT